MTADVLDIAEELYGLPLADFIPTRDLRVKELKGESAAAVLKTLKKPSTAAWVINLLVRHETEQVDQVLAVGAALREAQDGMDAVQLRELTRQRRQLTAVVTQRARALARQHGLRVTDPVAEQVEGTLTAAMIDRGAAGAVRSGLLVTALAATGVGEVDAVAALALPEAVGHRARAVEEEKPTLHVVPDPEPDARALDEAREALTAAEHVLSAARSDRDEAAAEVGRLEARSLQVQAEIDEVRRRLAELEETAQQVDDELAEAEDARAAAADSVADAEEAVNLARSSLHRLERPAAAD